MTEVELVMKCSFTLYEAKILLALQKSGTSTARQLAKTCDVPKNKIYEILDQMGREQITKIVPDKPKKYAIINLQEILKQRIEQKQKELAGLQKNIESLNNLDALPRPYEQTFWVMEGSSAMLDNVLESLHTIKEESLGLIDVWAAKHANFKAVDAAIKRGVNFYFIGTINKKTRPIAREYARLGVQIRHYPVQGAGYSVFDKKNVQLRITEKKLILLTVESQQFASILRHHFFEIWKQAQPVTFNRRSQQLL